MNMNHEVLSERQRMVEEAWLDPRRSELPAASPPALRRRNAAGAPLSYAQKRLWFFQQLEPESPLYNIPAAFRLRGRLNREALQQALNVIVRRHEVLRTRFVSKDGTPWQVITAPPADFPLPVIDLSPVPAARRETEAERLLQTEAIRPFNLTQDLMLRANLIALGSDDHLLALDTHHIASDGWSVGVFLRELAELYQAFDTGREPALPVLPVQYADYALWQNDWLQDAGMEEPLAYWKRQLAGAPAFLELPADHPRRAVQTFRGHWQWQTLPQSLADALKELSQRERVTPFMTLLAAFQTLLHRYTQVDDIVVGSPVAGRNRIETENLIGFFVNTLVLRTDMSGNPGFRELLHQVREVVLDALAHQDMPFDRLVQELRPERSTANAPLVQVLFVLQNDPLQGFKLPGLAITPVSPDKMGTGTAKFDLTFQMGESSQGITLAAEYNTDLFEHDTIARMLGNFRTLLESIAAWPEQKISDLPLLAPAERHRVFVEWSSAATEYPRGKTIPQLVEEQAERTPARIALRAGATVWSYSELEARANRIAQTLRSRGVSRGQRVGLCVERSADMPAAMLGVLKAGAVYVPLDASFPRERLRFIADDAQLSLLISTTNLASPFNLPHERQLLLDADAQVIASASATRLPADDQTAQPGDPAYIIHTSGSTGKPKGVVVPHRAVVNLLASMARQPGLVADDVLVAVTTLSFDIAVLELLLPLIVGATVVIATGDETFDGRALGALLEQHRATVMQATPVTWRLLLEEGGWTPQNAFKALVGGETMPKDLADQLLARGVELWNMYGPTETTIWSTCARITDTTHGITIGRPIANTTVRILDSRKNLCPVGVPGELCIGGEGVSLGYWNQPALTAARFIPDPYAGNPERRSSLRHDGIGAERAGTGAGVFLFYKTGDRARWRSDGTLEHLGRLDFQTKLRGFRIEPGEIEAAIAQHPAVREAAVVAREDTPGEKRLVAYVAAVSPPADLAGQLRARLRAVLPEYMVPAQFVVLRALPRTPNGKLDRQALPVPDAGEGMPGRTVVAPRTAAEVMVTGVFRDVLGRSDFGTTDNFFDLGGHSLMAARLIHKLRAASGLDLPLRLLFEHPTPARLAEALDRLDWLEKSKASGHGNVASQREEIEL